MLAASIRPIRSGRIDQGGALSWGKPQGDSLTEADRQGRVRTHPDRVAADVDGAVDVLAEEVGRLDDAFDDVGATVADRPDLDVLGSNRNQNPISMELIPGRHTGEATGGR